MDDSFHQWGDRHLGHRGRNSPLEAAENELEDREEDDQRSEELEIRAESRPLPEREGTLAGLLALLEKCGCVGHITVLDIADRDARRVPRSVVQADPEEHELRDDQEEGLDEEGWR